MSLILPWNMTHYTERHALNMCSKQDFIPMLKVVRNLFQTFHLHVDSSMRFRYQILYMRNLKIIHCPLRSDLPAKIQPAITSFSAGELHQQLAFSNNPGHD